MRHHHYATCDMKCILFFFFTTIFFRFFPRSSLVFNVGETEKPKTPKNIYKIRDSISYITSLYILEHNTRVQLTTTREGEHVYRMRHHYAACDMKCILFFSSSLRFYPFLLVPRWCQRNNKEKPKNRRKKVYQLYCILYGLFNSSAIDIGGLVEKSSLCEGRMASRSFSKTVRYDQESRVSSW